MDRKLDSRSRTENLIVLTSGGLDSFVARYFARAHGFENIRSLWINIGQPYAEKEMSAIQRFPFPVEIIECFTVDPIFGNVPTINQQVIPGRNLLFAIIAASMGGERIWLGALEGEMHTDVGSRDKTPEFFSLTTGLLSFTFKPRSEEVILETPFQNMTKAEMITWALQNGISPNQLRSTSTCYHPEHDRCGQCGACFKRWIALILNEIDEDYRYNPWISEYARRMLNDMKQAIHIGQYSHYSRKRVKETFEALRRVRELDPEEWRIYSLAMERDNV